MARGIVGQIVKVGKPSGEDLWQQPFVGTIRGVQGTSYSIEDQKGDVYDVDESQIREWC